MPNRGRGPRGTLCVHTMPLLIRDATAADADLLAWVQVEASRSGTPLGFWDLALPGADAPRLRTIAKIATSPREHFAHASGFLVAEIDGEPWAR